MAEELHIDIGKRIAARRKILGLTQENLAEILDVSVQMISNLERGRKAVRLGNLIKLSSALNVSCDYILTGKQQASDLSELTSKIAKLNPEDYGMVELIVNYCGNK